MATVMVVDDASFMRIMLRQLIEGAGHTVVCEAVDGLDAIDKYKKYRPDLVTMDITMPEMEGVDALRAIRQFDPRARVIMCSAVGHQHRIVEAIQLGASDFLVKPFMKERVVEALHKVSQAIEAGKK
ncbi:response regulator [Paenibacillus cymbidii]|uniref:response regulator n=1 Tax=Paenibacillus cymbidii TaxID=1639034 RepID=UPI0010805DF4|nr:response regulator [Paenibacillus cymbidii]